MTLRSQDGGQGQADENMDTDKKGQDRLHQSVARDFGRAVHDRHAVDRIKEGDKIQQVGAQEDRLSPRAALETGPQDTAEKNLDQEGGLADQKRQRPQHGQNPVPQAGQQPDSNADPELKRQRQQASAPAGPHDLRAARRGRLPQVSTSQKQNRFQAEQCSGQQKTASGGGVTV